MRAADSRRSASDGWELDAGAVAAVGTEASAVGAAFAGARGASGTGREAWAGANIARNARSATEIKWSKGCPDSIIVIISRPEHASRRLCIGRTPRLHFPAFFRPPF